jgi:hypothetical protein
VQILHKAACRTRVCPSCSVVTTVGLDKYRLHYIAPLYYYYFLRRRGPTRSHNQTIHVVRLFIKQSLYTQYELFYKNLSNKREFRENRRSERGANELLPVTSVS